MLKKPAGGGWQSPVIVDRTTYTDKQWIMGDQNPQGISPYAGRLYMSWTSFSIPTGIVLARSTNSNASWSAPLFLARDDVQGSVPGVAPDGTVYVVFGRSVFEDSGTIEFVKSTNGGVSFSSPAVAASITPIPFYLPNSWFRSPASLPAFAVSPTDGALYIAWADYGRGDADIYLTRSTNGGDTWTVPTRLNDDPIANGVDQFQPQVSVAPNGRVAVMWFDRRLTCPDYSWIPADHRGNANFCIDTFLTRSYDGGQTWAPNIRASAQTWDWTLNLPRDGNGNGFIGDYQGIASNNDYDFPFWNATANLGENAENYQEIFVALVPANDPFIVETYPADGEINVPAMASLSITFNAPVIITDTLFYAVTPDPGGWTENWSDGNTVLTLGHANWAYSQTYTVTVVIGEGGTGTVLAPGSAPNPWTFTTVPVPCCQLYLPLIVRE